MTAKNTHAQEVATGTSDSYAIPAVDPDAPTRVRRAMLGGEPTSVGSNSSESTMRQGNDESSRDPSPQLPAHTTGSRLSQTEPASDVDSTDGDGQKATLKPSGRRTRGGKSTGVNKSEESAPADDFEDFS